MAYATLANLRGAVGYLDQLTATDADRDTILTAVLARAEAFVNSYIGTPTSLVAAASATKTVYGNDLQILPLPAHTPGSVSLVTTLSGYTVPDYIEQNGHLVITDSTGLVLSPWRYGLAHSSGSTTVWARGLPYTITAAWGWGSSDLAILAEATLQIAVQLWRYRDAGGSETIGTDAAVTTIRANFTPLIKMGLDEIAERVRGVTGGIH